MTQILFPPGNQDAGSTEGGLTRRTLLRSLAATVGTFAASPWITEAAWRGALEARAQAAAAVDKGALPHFFDTAQREAFRALADVILPSDEHSPGASEAGVTDFVDYMLTGVSEETQRVWREGLEALDHASRELGAKPFAELSDAQRIELVTRMSRNEADPKSPLERLFVEAKANTILGYYTSEIGIHKELGYKGNQYLEEFQGCTHPEHQA